MTVQKEALTDFTRANFMGRITKIISRVAEKLGEHQCSYVSQTASDDHLEAMLFSALNFHPSPPETPVNEGKGC